MSIAKSAISNFAISNYLTSPISRLIVCEKASISRPATMPNAATAPKRLGSGIDS